MIERVAGKIISTQIGIFGPDEMKYGYISIQTKNNMITNIKIDAYTMYETLAIGDSVIIEAEFLGSTDILVAKNVFLAEDELTHPADTAKAAT